jgi:hypothetical protein
MPERNVELLEKTMQHILDHPEKHDQNYWFTQTECGTAACFAGWACLLSGYEVNWSSEDAYTNLSGTRRTWGVTGSDGEESDAIGSAQELLGLTSQESNTLFCSDNSREALQLMVKDLVNGDELRHSEEYEANTPSR